jgi:hypothetical protein
MFVKGQIVVVTENEQGDVHLTKFEEVFGEAADP